MSYKFADGFRAGLGRSVLILLASCNCNLYDIHLLLCVLWKTPDDRQRNCPKYVEFYSKDKFEKLVHLIAFIIRIYHDARSPELSILYLIGETVFFCENEQICVTLLLPTFTDTQSPITASFRLVGSGRPAMTLTGLVMCLLTTALGKWKQTKRYTMAVCPLVNVYRRFERTISLEM